MTTLMSTRDFQDMHACQQERDTFTLPEEEISARLNLPALYQYQRDILAQLLNGNDKQYPHNQVSDLFKLVEANVTTLRRLHLTSLITACRPEL